MNVDRAQLPLNALRAFEASARHLSLTRAAEELCVTQAAVSHQVKALERRLNVGLFRRMPNRLVLTDEGQALAPMLGDCLDRMTRALSRYDSAAVTEVLTVGSVGTFATRWLLPRLAAFREACPLIDLRLMTHNNKVDMASDGLDLAILFGDGDWPGLAAEQLLGAPMTPLCAPQIAARLEAPRALAGAPLLRSYRNREWPAWFEAAGVEPPSISGPVFDSLTLAVHAAVQSVGVALAPPAMFQQELASGQLVQPFGVCCDVGAYWLAWPRHKPQTEAMSAFRHWCAG
ncbi:MAG TPA: LysR family transcriptional regulator [Caulobacteraceae bacterium]|nr:LysR family transcriptional regulator [Caulobacteraceae bacterium]